jgi:hypothetical protein
MTGKTLSIKGMLLKEENLVGFSCRLFAIIGGHLTAVKHNFSLKELSLFSKHVSHLIVC